MSLATWEKEFYPIPAKQVTKNAVSHSLRKWEGLRKETLERHRLRHDRGDLIDLSGNRFRIDGETCALCHHFRARAESDEHECVECPLYRVRGNASCDEATDKEYAERLESPYMQFVMFNDPEPMIECLKLALEKGKSNAD